MHGLECGFTVFSANGLGGARKWITAALVTVVCVGFPAKSLDAQSNTFPATGYVGAGTTAPGTPLAVNGVISAGGNYYNTLSYSFNGTPVNGIKIKTNVPYQSSSLMPTVVLEGFNYGAARTIGLTISWYIYAGAFYNAAASSFGGYTPPIQLSDEGGKVVIFINDKQYYNRFSARAYAQGLSEVPGWFNGWSAADETLAASANTVTVPYVNNFGTAQFSGYVGIGNTGLQAPLDVLGGPGGPSAYNKGVLQVATGTNVGVDIGNYAPAPYASWIQSQDSRSGVATAYPLVLNPQGGNVGIGMTAPPYKLSVKGVIGAGEVIVTDTSGWADYVFDAGYRLQPLGEVAEYIAQNHHLPEIPSTAEVGAKGVSLGEMQAKLLAKIEELTLHVIAGEKKNLELQERMARMERENGNGGQR